MMRTALLCSVFQFLVLGSSAEEKYSLPENKIELLAINYRVDLLAIKLNF